MGNLAPKFFLLTHVFGYTESKFKQCCHLSARSAENGRFRLHNLQLLAQGLWVKCRYASLTRVSSDQGPLLDAPVGSDDRSTVSDVEMAGGTPSPKSPISQRGGTLTPRNSNGPNGLPRASL